MKQPQQYIKHRSPVTALGFAMLNHAATLDLRISPQAYRLLGLYLMYAQQSEACWPARKTVAKKLGYSETSVSRYNTELAEAGYITRERHIGRSSTTWIEDATQNPYLVDLAQSILDDRVARRTTDGTTHVPEVVQPCTNDGTDKKNHAKKNQQREPDTSGDEPKDEFADLWAGTEPGDLHKPANLPRGDVLELMAHVHQVQAQEGTWSVPDTVPTSLTEWADQPLIGFCALTNRQPGDLSNTEIKNWPAELRRWALDRKTPATPQETFDTLQALVKTEFSWMTFTTPFSDNYKTAMNVTLGRLRRGDPLNSEGRAPTKAPADPQVVAALRTA